MNKLNQLLQIFKHHKTQIIASFLLIIPLNPLNNYQNITLLQNFLTIKNQILSITIAQNNSPKNDENQQKNQSNTTSENQQERSSILESIWKLLKAKRKQEPALSSRSNLCEISPGLLGEINIIYSDRPLFLWQGKANNLKINLYTPFSLEQEQKILWSKIIENKNSDIQYLFYTGKPLEAGKIYDWETVVNNSSSRKMPFQIMEKAKREQISLELIKLESELRNSGVKEEEIILAKANYFAERDLWSDAIQILFSLNNSTTNFSQEIQKMTEFICEFNN
jgi:hypothetical protein